MAGEASAAERSADLRERPPVAGFGGAFESSLDTGATGEEDEFGRKNLPYIDTYSGIWVISCLPTFYLTTGGLAIDTAGRVLTEAGESIAGLYAAGDVCGSIEEKDGRPYAMGFDAAMNYGYLMAEAVIADI